MEQAASIPELDGKGLRNFGFVLGGAVAIFFGLLLPWLFATSYPLWPWAVVAGLAAWSLLNPMSLRPIYRVWMRFGLVLNRITTPIVLGLIFFLLLMPIGVVRRIFGRDSIAKRRNPDKASYRVQSDIISKESLERPF